MKRLIIILALVSIACGQTAGMLAEEPRKRATIPTMSAPTLTAIPKRELCGDVNVREQPEPTGRVVRWLVAGDEVEVSEEREGWVRISPATAPNAEWITGGVLCPSSQ